MQRSRENVLEWEWGCLLTGAQELVRVCIESVSWSGNGDCLLTGAQELVIGLGHVLKSGI